MSRRDSDGSRDTGTPAAMPAEAPGAAAPGPDAPGPDAPGPDAPGPDALAGHAWHAASQSEALAALGSTDAGLSGAEAARRQAAFGPNVVPKTPGPGPLLIYARQFKNPLVYLLLAATVVSVMVGELTDAAFIFVVLQFNAAIGTYQEWRAENAAEALDALIRNVVSVRRDGRRQKLEAAELVPGDVVELASGDRVPADLRLLAGRELTLDESLMTGESLPVGKSDDAVVPPDTPLSDRGCMLYAGTTVLAGRATGAVVATAGWTEIGRIAEALASGAGAAPPLIRQLDRFSRAVGIATLVLIGAIGVAQFAQGVPLVTVFMVAVALAVAAIPEGLPIAITVALAIATNRMARRNVIVRSLPAVEGLGACTLIASDKTGTLTMNELTVRRLLLFGADGRAREVALTEAQRPGSRLALAEDDRAAATRLAVSAALCNEGSLHVRDGRFERLGDTVDTALLVFAGALGLEPEALRAAAPSLGAVPYEPHRCYAACFTGGPEAPAGSALAHVKGAAEVLLPHCGGLDRERARTEADRLSAEGYRVIAVARGRIEVGAAVRADLSALHDLELLGFVGLIDPLRPEVPEALQRCHSAGVAVRMVTGDHPGTALAIARELGLAERMDQVVTGAALATALDDTAAFDRLVAQARVFARVDPRQKLTIVESLQRAGEVVAVTGDGVNDAPALTAANIGVAMGRDGTDVARAAADLILTDDNFVSIVAGIEEGRVAYDNVRKLVYLLITTGLGEIVLFLLAILAGLPVPLTAVQLLWLNLVTNGVQDIALAFERGEPGILERPPRRPRERIFNRQMIRQVLISGTYMGLAAFLYFYWCLARGLPEAQASNLLLLLMVIFENAHALNSRSERRSVLRLPLAANPFLILAILGAQGLHVLTLYLPGPDLVLGTAPISFADWLEVVAIAASLILVAEAQKLLARPG